MRILITKAKRLRVLALAASLIGLFLAFCCWRLAPRVPAEYIPPSVQLQQSSLVGRGGGEKQWEILTATVLQEGNRLTLSEMEKIVIFQDGQPHLYLNAETAVWERESDILELMGQVVVSGPEQFRLQSELLIWDGGKETLTSPGPVRLAWQNLDIRADQMVYKMEGNAVILRDNVEIREDRLVWEMGEAVYYLQEEVLEFVGDLVLKREEGLNHGQN